MSNRAIRSVTIPIEVTIRIGDPVVGETGAATASVAATGAAAQNALAENTPPAQLEGLFGGSSEEPDFFEQLRGRFSLAALSDDGFAWENVLNQALCSTLAYEPESKIANHVKQHWGFSECQSFSIDNTECFVASSDEAVIVAFRGTQQTGDWLTNLNFAWTSRPFGAVHRGFNNAFSVVRAPLEEALAEVGAANKKVWITGHSLGGALATVASAAWHGKYPIQGVFTFGQPAVGFSAFRSFIDISYPDQFHRFVNEDDVVPRVPPGYRHVGKLFRFMGAGEIVNESMMEDVVEESQLETPTMSEAEFERMRQTLLATEATETVQLEESMNQEIGAEGFFPSVADHGMNRYLGKVAEQLS